MTNAPHPIRIDPDALTLDPLELDPADFQSPLPVQNYAVLFEDAAIGLAVGIWDTTTMQEAFGPYPGDEYITVLDGQFTMVDAAGKTQAQAGAGDSVTFRNGAPTSWKQDGYLRKVYLTLKAPGASATSLADAEGAFRTLGPDRLPQGSPDADGTTQELIFRNDTGTMTVTLCGFPALTLALTPCPTHRLIRILAGSIRLSGPAFAPGRFDTGAHVFLPHGTTCAWEVAAGTVAVMVDVTAA